MKKKRIFSFLMAAVTAIGSAAQCIGTAAAAEVSGGKQAATIIATGTNTVGSLIAPSLNDELKKLQNKELCTIFSTHSYENSATVFFSTNIDCKLVVGVYTDLYVDGVEKMVASSVTNVTAGQKTADVTFNITKMPTSYILKAYLIDADGSMLTPEYVDARNTLELREAMAPTSNVAYYEEKGYKVLNLDENTTTNFVVYNKAVKVLRTSGNDNKLISKNEKNGVYTIQNLKTTLKTNDIVSIENVNGLSEDDVTVFRVKKASSSGADTIVQIDTSMDPQDAFDYIKIQADTKEISKQPSQPKPSAGNDKMANGSSDYDSHCFTNTFTIDLTGDRVDLTNYFNLSMQAGGTMRFTVLCECKFGLIVTPNRETKDFEFTVTVAGNGGLFGSIKGGIPLGIMRFGQILSMLKLPKCDINFGGVIDLQVEIYGRVDGSFDISFGYDKTGVQSPTFHPIECMMDGYVFFGIAVETNAKIFGRGGSITARAGFIGEGTTTEEHPICDHHKCFDCKLSAIADFSIAWTPLFKKTPTQATSYAAITFQLGRAYFSNAGHGWGICPNRALSDAEDTQNENCLRYWPTFFYNDDRTLEHVEYRVELIPGANPKTVVIPATHRSPYKSDDYGECPVTAIEVSGFKNATNLESIHLPDTIKVIGCCAFQGCKNLKYINLPDGLTEIQGSAFSGCSKLEQISIPEGVTEIQANTFCGCTCLKNVYLPSTIKKISSEAFRYCSSLEHFSTPASIQTIERGAFWDSGITSFALNSDNSFSEFNFDDIFRYSGNVRYLAVNAPVKEIYQVPENVSLTINYPDDLEILNNKPYHQSVSIDTNIPAPTPEPTKTVTFTNLQPNTLYNFYDLVGGKTITTEKLLYITQKMTDKNGKLTVRYRPMTNNTTSYQFVHCCIDNDANVPLNQNAKFTSRIYKQNATYRWQYKNGKNWSNDPSWNGTGSPVLNVPVTNDIDGKQYRCVIMLPNNINYNSTPVAITVKPKITQQPQSAKLAVDKTAKYSVTAKGANLSYQWQYNAGKGWYNSSISGNKTAVLSVPVITARDGYLYRCVITAANGETVISDEASLTVKAAITKQPESATKLIDENAVFSVTATGKNPSYQWQYNDGKGWKNSTFSGNKTASINVTASPARNGYKYRCIVKSSNGTSVTSSAATLTVQAKIIYKANGGTGSNVVQKHVSGSAVTLKPANTFTREGYTFNGWNAQADGSGNSYAAGQKVAWKNNVYLYAQWKPVQVKITKQPTSVTQAAGTTAKFTVTASGTNLTYQWQYNDGSGWKDSSFSGNKTSTLNVTVETKRNGYKYRCVIKSSNGTSVTSNAATLTVK